MVVKLLTEHHLEFLILKEGCTGSSESTLVKIPHCWKSHVTAHLYCLVRLPFLSHSPALLALTKSPHIHSKVISKNNNNHSTEIQMSQLYTVSEKYIV